MDHAIMSCYNNLVVFFTVNTEVLIHPRSSLVYDGDQFQLNCTFIGDNIMDIRWERAGPFNLPGGPRWGMTTDKISTNVGSVRVSKNSCYASQNCHVYVAIYFHW